MAIAKYFLILPRFLVSIIKHYLLDAGSNLPGAKIRHICSWSVIMLFPILYLLLIIYEPAYHTSKRLFGECPTKEDGEYSIVNFDGYLLRIRTDAILDCYSPYIGSHLDTEPHWIALSFPICSVTPGFEREIGNVKNSREECRKIQVNFLILGKLQAHKSNNYLPRRLEDYANFELPPYLVNDERILDAIKHEMQSTVIGFQNYSVIGGKESVFLILAVILLGLYVDRNHLLKNVLPRI